MHVWFFLKKSIVNTLLSLEWSGLTTHRTSAILNENRMPYTVHAVCNSYENTRNTFLDGKNTFFERLLDKWAIADKALKYVSHSFIYFSTE